MALGAGAAVVGAAATEGVSLAGAAVGPAGEPLDFAGTGVGLGVIDVQAATTNAVTKTADKLKAVLPLNWISLLVL